MQPLCRNSVGLHNFEGFPLYCTVYCSFNIDGIVCRRMFRMSQFQDTDEMEFMDDFVGGMSSSSTGFPR